jgi:hypothetical protein
MTAELVSRTVWATLLGDFAGSDKAVFHEIRMIYQPDGEFPGFGWIEELLQAKPQEKDVGPRLGPDLQEQVNGALNQRLGFFIGVSRSCRARAVSQLKTDDKTPVIL